MRYHRELEDSETIHSVFVLIIMTSMTWSLLILCEYALLSNFGVSIFPFYKVISFVQNSCLLPLEDIFPTLLYFTYIINYIRLFVLLIQYAVRICFCYGFCFKSIFIFLSSCIYGKYQWYTYFTERTFSKQYIIFWNTLWRFFKLSFPLELI